MSSSSWAKLSSGQRLFEIGDKVVGTEAALGWAALPTLVLLGEADPLIGLDAGRKFAAVIPDAQKVYPGVGHLPQIEVSAASAHDVAAFLATIAP